MTMIGAAAVSMVTSAGGDEWRIETVNGRAAESETEVILEVDGSLSGSTGCNRFQGSGEFRDGVLVISALLATTQMACTGDALTAQDDAVLALLQGEITLISEPTAQRLTLLGANGTMTLVAAGPSIFDAGYLSVVGVSDALNIRAEPTTSAPVVTRLRSGTVVRNSGCEQRPDRAWCQVTLIDSSTTQGWAAGEYLEAATAGLRASQSVYDQIGRLSCTQVAGEPVSDCEFGLARDNDGTIVLAVFGEGGFKRYLTFQNGVFAFADVSQAGGAFDAVAEVDSDVHFVSVGVERYEVPDGVVSGG